MQFETAAMSRWWEEHRSEGALTTLSERVAPENLFEALVGGRSGCFHTNGITVRRSFFERCGLFPPELRMCQDTALWLKMALVGRLAPGVLDRPVAMRRMHGENRIVKDRQKHAAYSYRMYRWLLRWAEERGIEEGRRRLILWQALAAARFQPSAVGLPERAKRARAAAALWMTSPTARKFLPIVRFLARQMLPVPKAGAR